MCLAQQSDTLALSSKKSLGEQIGRRQTSDHWNTENAGAQSHDERQQVTLSKGVHDTPNE
jgi:hypothetical protein